MNFVEHTIMNTPTSSIPPRKRSRGLAHGLVEDLTNKIRGSVFSPGAKFPTEPELMAAYGVSRTVVREALSSLQAAGLVETRHGVGTFVLESVVGALPDMGTVVTLRDVIAMLELRISLEAEAASLAALRRMDEHLAAMKEAVAAFAKDIHSGGAAVDADFNFHLQIALATGNRYFEEFMRYLGKTTIPRTRLNTWQLTPEPGVDYLERTHQEHVRILQAIELKDPESARACMRMHLADSKDRLRRVMEQNEASASS
jgi:GntR family transcriptional regulator, transcriptional repressor for pyruvate dehydrogenase complex